MADQQHCNLLRQGTDAWNTWRSDNPTVQPDLSGAELGGTDLSYANLDGANLSGAILCRANLCYTNLSGADLSYVNLSHAKLIEADFSGANLSGAILSRANLCYVNLSYANLNEADLCGANLSCAVLGEANLSYTNLGYVILVEAVLSGAILIEAKLINANLSHTNLSYANLNRADLSGANLSEADLSEADLSEADLSGANLSGATLVRTNLAEANLTDCRIYEIATGNVELKGARQDNLVITPHDEPTITVDDLEVAQFIYLLLNNSKLCDIIDTTARKAVLILGRITPERKVFLDALKETLRTHGYLPILFDFEKPGSRNFTEAVRTLAHLSRFIIADLTDPSGMPQELQTIISTLAVPVQPILLKGKWEYAMFADFLKTFHWVLPIYHYRDQTNLLATLDKDVIEPAECKAQELAKR
jgi:uncharacterized protein YjbI with pentapeptide repeats